MPKIRIGTRESQLALAQVKEAIEFLPRADYELVVFQTSGDKDKVNPLELFEGSDFFTDTIEQALLENKIDLAIHSAKDLPAKLRDGLKIAKINKSIDRDDVLVSRTGLKLSHLRQGARVGTSSQRRKEQVLSLRPDLKVIPLRGNVDQRLEKLDRGEYEAIIVAAAALIRLGLEDRIAERLPFETAKGQGALAFQVRTNDKEINEWLWAKSI